MAGSAGHTSAPSVLELQIPDTEFIVCDVETTGLSADRNRMTEIALRRVVNGEIAGRFDSLINPHQFISREIERLTGISNSMVYDAPEEGDVMERALEFIGNGVFVAHNARFDRSFVDAAIERCGLPAFDAPTLCTSRLAHRLIPKQRKTSLGVLANAMGIRINNRHRAGGDAEATALIFIRFLEIMQEEFHFTDTGEVVSFQYKPVYRITTPPKNIAKLKASLAELPPPPGVYFFHYKYGTVIYGGKAKSLRDRVNSYFYHNLGHTEKVRKLVKSVQALTWKTTETELSALLLEAQSIKHHQPQYNSKLKSDRKYPFIRINSQLDFPTVDWSYEIENDGAEYFGPFTSRFAVEDALDSINKLFRLRECEGKIKPDPDGSPCIYYEIKRCNAPCIALVTQEEYLLEVEMLSLFLRGKHEEMMDTFRNRMLAKSELQLFEDAAVIRDRMAGLERIIRQQRVMARSVRKQNLVIVTLARRTFVEVHLIKTGMLAAQVLVDQKHVKAVELRAELERVFYSQQEEIFGSRREDINEMRIIASWCLTRRDDSTVIEADEFAGLDELLAYTLDCIANAGREEAVAALPTIPTLK